MLAIWLIVLAAGALLATQLDGALSGGGFTNPRAEALVTQKVVQKAFGDAPNQVVVVLDGDKTLTDPDYGSATNILRSAGATTITTPVDNSAFVSRSGHTAVITAGFDGDGTSAQNLVPGLQSKLSADGSAKNVYVTGQPALDFQLNAHSKEDATRAELIVFPLLIMVLLVVFGTVVATVLPLLVAGSALAIASGIGFLATHVTDISNLYSNIVSMIGLAVAVDYSLFIIKRFREELDRGETPADAVVTAMQTAGKSVLYSGIAVVLALAALFIPRVMAFTSIALGGIVVTIVALAVTVLVLPAGLVLLGDRVNRLRIPLPARREKRTTPHRHPRHPGLIGLAGIIVMLAVATPILGISLQSPVASATVLPANDPARIGLEVIKKDIGQEGLFPIDVILTSHGNSTSTQVLTLANKATEFLTKEPGVNSVDSVTTRGIPTEQLTAALDAATTPKPLSQVFHRSNGTTTMRLLVTSTQGPDSVQAHDLVRTIRTGLPAALGTGASVAVTGATAQGLDFDNTLIAGFPLIAGVVLLLTFLMLAFAFRSALLPALALLFNVLVVAASLGLLTAVQHAVSTQPLNSVTPILLFAVMFGLSMDYMVIMISRMREAHRGGLAYDAAVLDGARRTRRMINSAAVIMIAVFCSFMTGQIGIVREIGIGLAIAVALDAVVIRIIVMPNILRAIGPRAFGAKRGTTETASEDAVLPGPEVVEV
ncbi:MMPL family transporter [Frondihabitans sucicola]|uniref:MMPL family transporter n=1 Tax=Frondihabitans sucicola TaxID=1268041 RepID=UPI0025737A9A|nr:MMPL family transporter [Frondihabitans sucicola]